MAVIHPYYRSVYRIRGWGRLPRKRGATLAICNHQHDLDTTGVIMRLSVQGPWMHPIFAVTSRRLFEPGFMSAHYKWLEPIVRSMNWGGLFRAIGMLPLENEPRRRPVAAIACAVMARHGDLPVEDAFDPASLDGLDVQAGGLRLSSLLVRPRFLAARDKYVSLAVLREPYRSEIVARMRTQVEEDLDRIASVLRAGGTLYLTPEGRYTKDGKLSRFRMAIDRLAGIAKVYVLALSYDPFVGRRLSLLFRVLPAQDLTDLRSSLCAPRPVTVSQLLAAALGSPPQPFSEADARAAVRSSLAGLPSEAFVDPELAADPDRMIRLALPTMVRLGILTAEGDRYRLSQLRRHPQFPGVDDIVLHQANHFAETIAALRTLG
jgi:1-acyl-sn-glycerol-3-phosphate acyltransferase